MAFFLTVKFTLLAITVFLTGITTAQISSAIATLVTEIVNYRSTSGALSELIVPSVTACAWMCSRIAECRSLFYNENDKLCQLHDVVFENYGPNLTYVYQTYHYKMMTVESNFTCPIAPPDASYNTALLQDNTVFTYRTVWEHVDKVTAATACVADGARLVQVLSLAKMKTLVNLFTTCPGYVNEDNYWIDGSNINATDVFDISQWVTSDGEPLPTTNQFWAPGWPQDTEIHRCVALWATFDEGWVYQWVNPPCSYLNYYICEK